ncbi:MAG: thiol reductase thioredoxin [Caldithrix sp.]|nr:thiol reductase thioredoxin [Caldithrix sp.]
MQVRRQRMKTELKKVVEKNNNTIIVEFYTEWSASSYMIGELLKELQEAYAGSITVAFVNADANPQLCSDFGIQKIPALLFFKNRQVVSLLQGTPSRSEIERIIQNFKN